MKYQFCQQIDRHLCFNLNNLYSCTVGNNTNGQSLPMIKENYNGEIINWIEFFKKREEIKQGFREGKPLDNCKGCYFLHEEEWDKINETWEFKYIQFSHWQMCNSKCIYCTNHTPYDKSIKTDTYDSVPVLRDLINKKYVNERTKVDFAGGEPTLYYHFDDLVNLLFSANVSQIIVHSNAILYNKTIETGLKRGTLSLCVSIDAGSKAVHEKVKGVKSFDTVWRNIKKYAKAKNSLAKNYISLKYIIIPNVNDTEAEIDLWLSRCLKANVNQVVLNADNNIFINQYSEEEKQCNLKTVVILSEYFVKRAKDLNLNARLEFNVNAAYQTLNIPIPQLDYNYYI